ncbi:serine-rich protein-like protein [Rhynchospora pubera]|uniref:Serine-rich protein-like protein n=1 Tax=Rhynchospora pubera TaxID=906938 RepID=A0AAV8DLD6_9POAL|nr:serine-rich protein-like protein [Rhynchospora pubera]
MRASSKRSSGHGPVLPVTSQFSRSISPSNRLGGGATSAFAATSPSLSSSSAPTSSHSFLTRPASPTRVNFSCSNQPAPSVKFSLPISHRPISPNRNISAVKPARRRSCMCSPTTHPGSFRCSLHKAERYARSAPPSSSRLHARRSAMTNSLIRISTVEGDLVKRALAALIRPSSHRQRRRGEFQPRPSRLSAMSKATDTYEL